MDFQITIAGRHDLCGQVYRALRAAILGGRLRAGQQLPSTRELASQLRLARQTVVRAYERLLSESLVAGRTGSGTRVHPRLALADQAPPRRGSVLRPRPEWTRITGGPATGRPAQFDFSVGVPDVSLFPFAIWRSLLASSGRVLGAAQGAYAEGQGDRRLRLAIARYISFTRGVVCEPDQIVVTHGAQQAFDLVARVLLAPGDIAAVEEPGYPPFRELLTTHGVKIAPAAVDGEGLRITEIAAQARLVYVTPSHQFPTGVPMSLERKLNLLRWAARNKACILEDDYDSEYRFDPRPLEALQSLDRHGVVVYVGTFSKVMVPGLRIGFIVAPATLVAALVEARRLSDWHESALVQLALARFISEGHLARHVRRMAKIYGRRRNTLLEQLRRYSDVFGDLLPSVAGLHVTSKLDSGKRVKELMRMAERAGAYITPLSRFSLDPESAGIVLGYGAISEERIAKGIKRIAASVGAG